MRRGCPTSARRPPTSDRRRAGAWAGFIDPRTKPKILDGGILTLEVGIGVNARGEINRVKVYDYRGNVELTKDAFLGQLQGRNLDCSFKVGKKGIAGVPEEPEESQLVANAGREALLLMRTALGSGAEIPKCPV